MTTCRLHRFTGRLNSSGVLTVNGNTYIGAMAVCTHMTL